METIDTPFNSQSAQEQTLATNQKDSASLTQESCNDNPSQHVDKGSQLSTTKQVKVEITKAEVVKLNAWKGDTKFGDFVEGSLIFPCKAFLSNRKWDDYLTPEQRFDLVDLVQHINQRNLKIGLIIDLNRSFDYYSFEEIQKETPLLSETKYIKFMLENAAVPDEQIVEQVYELLKEHHEKSQVVVIHCFNGINRTGYIVADFLCRTFGLSGEEAVAIFQKARNQKIEHQNMVESLKKKYPTSTK